MRPIMTNSGDTLHDSGFSRFLRLISPLPIVRVRVSPWLYRLLIAAGARPAPPPRKRPGRISKAISLDDFLDWLDSHPYSDLLEFHTHAALPRLAKRLQCGCIGTITFLFDIALRQVEAVEVELIGMSGSPEHDDLLQAVSLLRNKLDDAKNFTSSIEDELPAVRDLTERVAAHLDDQSTPGDLRDSLLKLQSNFDRLERILNDFSGADLNDVDLSGIRLQGIRWTRATTWPRKWRGRIARNSVRIAPGVFLIQGEDPVLRGPEDA
ncbi:hypothetical protein AB0C29_34715 [Actinoplanes sp. NPDC048791]|uniref:hypothetical protein n=1 Tax=Actinoplanes sp. NPDC048791 TaxID=3154623 RepID=UPI0034070CC8